MSHLPYKKTVPLKSRIRQRVNDNSTHRVVRPTGAIVDGVYWKGTADRSILAYFLLL
jgi:hypothetical protein